MLADGSNFVLSRLSPNLKGIILMTVAMGLLAVGDATIKTMSGDYHQSVFMIVAGIGLVAVFSLVAVRTGDKILDRRALSGAPLFRSLAEIAAALSMIFALFYVPFTILTLVMQSMPLIVTLGAVLVFDEKVGPRRWAAILVGLVGVAIILRPGGQTFEIEWLLAVVAAFALSARDLSARAVPKDISTLQISTWGGAAVILAGIGFHIFSGQNLPVIALSDVPKFTLIVACWTGGIFAVTSAMRIGDVSAVAPFRYTRLPYGLLIGVFFFGEAVDAWMVLGVAVIVASGLYIFFRERAA